ncbi:MAG: macro domain-containing protein [Candidatus Eisenbacteria sp.]|nr:macro domain-containing protein [Candidatus Eisenbacteria bacterium]
MCAALRSHFKGMANTEVVNGRFQDLPEFCCMVSPANSFGLMDGGVDDAIVGFFGCSLERRVQQLIREEFGGEQPVGTSIIVETDYPRHPFVAHTPTMRIPMLIAGTDNVYVAMWAMLQAVRRHNRGADRPIRIVACPALGTGAGGMAPDEAARQMALAYEYSLAPPAEMDWTAADKRHEKILYAR